MFFLFMPAGHIVTARDLGNAAETNNGITTDYVNIKHRHLKIWVGIRVQYTKFNVQYRNLLHDHFSGKV